MINRRQSNRVLLEPEAVADPTALMSQAKHDLFFISLVKTSCANTILRDSVTLFQKRMNKFIALILIGDTEFKSAKQNRTGVFVLMMSNYLRRGYDVAIEV